MLAFQNDVFETMCSCAKNTYPRECCGILLGRQEKRRRIVYRILPTLNAADAQESARRFLIDPLEIYRTELAAEQEGLTIVGFYHSHPSGEEEVSEEDALHMIAGLSYPVVAVKKGICTAVRSFEKMERSDVVMQEEILIKER
ncbi:MAG: M67 family metallopeptidase [Selenomonadales bacterium]|nr:M67 family metallopeptidase [Selenomonadales bacterium]